jgi:hypothetical protein
MVGVRRQRRAPLVIRSVAFDRDDLTLLDAVAQREERSVSSLIRLAVRRELARHRTDDAVESRRSR